MNRPRSQRVLARWLRMHCDRAARRSNPFVLRELHAYLTQIAATYVRFRLEAIEARVRGENETAAGYDAMARDLIANGD